jgi:hypothetical protein
MPIRSLLILLMKARNSCRAIHTLAKTAHSHERALATRPLLDGLAQRAPKEAKIASRVDTIRRRVFGRGSTYRFRRFQADPRQNRTRQGDRRGLFDSMTRPLTLPTEPRSPNRRVAAAIGQSKIVARVQAIRGTHWITHVAPADLYFERR